MPPRTVHHASEQPLPVPHHPHCEQLLYTQFKSPSSHLKSFPLVPSRCSLPFLSGGQVLLQSNFNLPQTHTKERFLAADSTLTSVTPAPHFPAFLQFFVRNNRFSQQGKFSRHFCSSLCHANTGRAGKTTDSAFIIIITTYYPSLEGNWKKVQRILLFPSF